MVLFFVCGSTCVHVHMCTHVRLEDSISGSLPGTWSSAIRLADWLSLIPQHGGYRYVPPQLFFVLFVCLETVHTV